VKVDRLLKGSDTFTSEEDIDFHIDNRIKEYREQED